MAARRAPIKYAILRWEWSNRVKRAPNVRKPLLLLLLYLRESEEAPAITSNEVVVHNGDVIEFLL